MPLLSSVRGPTARYTLVQGSYWACYCSIITFSSVYLLSRGFSNAQIGLLMGGAGVLSALLQPFVSRTADRLRRMDLRQFTALLVLLQLAAGALLLLFPGRLPQTLLYGLLLVLIQLIMPLCSALGTACMSRGLPLNFGLARGMGSVAYGVFSAFCGQLVLWLGESSLLAAMTVVNLCLLLSVLWFRFRGTEACGTEQMSAGDGQAGSSGRPFYRTYHGVLGLLAGVVFLLLGHNILVVYTIQIIQPLGGDSGQMGTMILIQSLAELPAMFLFAWLLTRAGSRFWLKLSGIGFFVRAVGFWAAPNMLVMDAVQLLQMPSYALFTIASIYYINEMVRPSERVQGQAWLTMAITLGNVLASFAGGLILDWAGVRTLLAASVAAEAVGMVIFWFLLRKGSKTMAPKEEMEGR